MRDYKLYLDDILEAIKRIEKYTKGSTLEGIRKDNLRADGVVRNLEIIGEAVKNVPANVRDRYPSVEWKKIAGLRDILAHEYFGIDMDIIWDIIKTKLPILKREISRISKARS
jgi:uncharacterized protein with HEPN domain